MNFSNSKWLEAMEAGEYFCDQCGAKMEFEDEWADTLVCLNCGYSINIDQYGFTEEEYANLFPLLEEL